MQIIRFMYFFLIFLLLFQRNVGLVDALGYFLVLTAYCFNHMNHMEKHIAQNKTVCPSLCVEKDSHQFLPSEIKFRI